jgi:surface polysaccharide O-acyltransferase-like enzyme
MNNRGADTIWVDFVRVMATFFVVWLHSSSPLLYKYNMISSGYWWVGNFYNSIVRMSVPLFFMISGFLLINKTERLEIFFKKRIRKVVIPMIVWSVIYIFWKAYIERSSSISIHSFYSALLRPTYFHLWFLYAIIEIYLYIPILRIFVINSDKLYLYYFVALWVVASTLFFAKKAIGVSSTIDFRMVSGYVGYLLIGHLLGHMRLNKTIIACSILGYLISAGTTIYGTFFLSHKSGKFISILHIYLCPNVIILSVSSFILLRAVFENFSKLSNARIVSSIRGISSASFGIYLIHAMFLFLIRHGYLGYQLDVLKCNPIFSVPFTAVLCFFFSLIAVCFLKRIPYINQIVP